MFKLSHPTTQDLRRLQDLHGPQAGALAWFSQFHGATTLGILQAKFGSDAEDLYAAAIEKLLETEDPKTAGMILSVDEKRIGSWIQADATRRMSTNSRQKGDKERDHTRYGLEGEDYIADTARPVEDIVSQRLDTAIAREAFVACDRRPEHLRAFVLRHEEGESLDAIADQLGLKSRQAAGQLLDRIGNDLRKNLDAILEGRACPEVASLLSAVAWMPDALNELETQRVDAHLEHCSTCKELVATQRRSIPKALALFPMPIAIVAAQASPLAHMVDSVKGMFLRGQEVAANTTANAGSWQGARPIAAGVAVVALLGGGSAITIHEVTKDPKPKAAVVKPITHMVDPIKLPPVKKAKPKKKKAKKKAAPVAAPVQTTTPEPVQSAPAAEPEGVGDGSSEFLPEER